MMARLHARLAGETISKVLITIDDHSTIHRPMDCTSRQLRAFLLVAQHRSFTRAAAQLFIPPSGLSVLIRELEGQLGFRLFDRTTRHVAPTAAGGQFLPI